MDCRNPEVIASLLLAAALRENSSGIVLFSTIRPHRIQLAINAVLTSSAPANQILDAVLGLTEIEPHHSHSTKGRTR